MSDASGGDPRVHNLTTEEVARGLQEGRMLLVDVREPNEVDAEAYPDAVVVPLSVFDPAAIPGKTNGAMIIRTVKRSEAPRSELASISESGTRSNAANTGMIM